MLRALSRYGLVAGAMLTVLSLHLMQVVPPPDHCEAVAVIAGRQNRLIAVWDDGTSIPLMPLIGTTLVWNRQATTLLVNEASENGLVYQTTLKGRQVSVWRATADAYHNVLLWEPTNGYVYGLEGASRSRPRLYRSDSRGQQLEAIWTFPATPFLEKIAPDHSAMLYSMRRDQSPVWVVVDTRTGQVSPIETYGNGEPTLVIWASHAGVLLFKNDDGFYRVNNDGSGYQVLAIPPTYYRPWTYSGTTSAFFFLVTTDAGYALYYLDWQATTPRFIKAIDREDVYIGQVDKQHVVYRETTVGEFGNHLALLNIETGTVTDFGTGFSGEVRWVEAEQRLIFTDVGSPVNLMSFYPLRGEMMTHAALPRGATTPLVSPCLDSYWYRTGTEGFGIGRMDDPTAQPIPTTVHGDIWGWLDLRPIHWHRWLLLTGGLLLAGFSLLTTLWRGLRT